MDGEIQFNYGLSEVVRVYYMLLLEVCEVWFENNQLRTQIYKASSSNAFQPTCWQL